MANGVSQTLKTIMLDIGKRLDGAGSSGFVTGTATSGSLTNLLEDTTKLKSTISQDDLHRDAWIWRPDAVASGDRTTNVKDASSAAGTLTPDRTWTNPPYAGGVGETYAIFHTLSPDAILECINRALQRMYFESEVTLTPGTDPDNASNNGQLLRRYDVTTTYAWLTEPWQIRRVGYLSANLNRSQYWPTLIRGQAYREDNIMYLWLPAGFVNTNNGTFYMRTVRPHFTWINSANSTVGLVNATDTVDVELNWIVAGAMVEIFDLLGQQLDDAAMKKYTITQNRWAARFNLYSRQYFTLPRNEFYASEFVGIYGSGSGGAENDESGLAVRAF